MARERDTVCRGEERALGTSAVFGGVDEGARTREGRDGGQVQPGKRSYVHWVGLRTLAHHATGLLVVVRAPQYLRGSRSALLTSSYKTEEAEKETRPQSKVCTKAQEPTLLAESVPVSGARDGQDSVSPGGRGGNPQDRRSVAPRYPWSRGEKSVSGTSGILRVVDGGENTDGCEVQQGFTVVLLSAPDAGSSCIARQATLGVLASSGSGSQ